MRIVVALGGNALIKRGQPLTAEIQRENIRTAALALAPVAEKHELIISHGNGPQVGLLALQSSCYTEVESYPLDVLDAQTEGMIGYMIEQELGNILPENIPFATVLTMVEVDLNDKAFKNPTKFVGPVYTQNETKKAEFEKGWTFKKDGNFWRRVVPSPEPKRIFEIRPIKWLLEKGTVVICAGGGGIPTAFEEGNQNILRGIEAVIDKDLASALLASETGADLLVMATDVDGVYLDWGTEKQKLIKDITPEELKKFSFPAGSMGPKITAASNFGGQKGKRAVIGALSDIEKMVEGTAGTNVKLQD
ncbi:carbamate kinase [Methanoplanus sp. FWC-SCC4]|uniref:Carbamate kinase n=1 Tax=Methanochimaera problematica TaxID=2609417 RepID=A0AA97FG75_9EURY|nr:carbamate kinase [Methanoplanus sp. FWC-SCC4]WOF16866.1 carbamate kinase [Methanoplanus sp. FWC-SCC4]